VYYVALLSALCVLFTLPLYPLASSLGRLSLPLFARAIAPSQVVALSTQSSLASLPTMIDAAEMRLGSPPQMVGVVLPLAVAVFRYSTPIWLIVAALFVARVYGIDLAAGDDRRRAVRPDEHCWCRSTKRCLVLWSDYPGIPFSGLTNRSDRDSLRRGRDPGHDRDGHERDGRSGNHRRSVGHDTVGFEAGNTPLSFDDAYPECGI
jgi:Sodium:dicarboxylate symporter family